MSTANDRQVGGSHYHKVKYQHWDFATDTDMPYLIGCFTKYVTRWRGKNGTEDLEKSLHYLQKARERHVVMRLIPSVQTNLDRFCAQDQISDAEAFAIRAAVLGDYSEAEKWVRAIIAEA
jgi:hypothetical protein